MPQYTKLINRKKVKALSRFLVPVLSTPSGVEIHWISSCKESETFTIWRNGHGYLMTISQSGESLIAAVEKH